MPDNPALIAHSYMLIGLAINIWLYGIMITQVYLYYKNYPKDKLWLKLLVAVLTLADTLNVLFLFIYLYRSLIIHFNDPSYLLDPDWVFATDPALTGIVATMVQLFFAWRILVLTSNWFFFSLVATCAIAGLALLTAVDVVISDSFEEFREFKTVVIIWLAAEAIGDLIITGVLVRYLYVFSHNLPSLVQMVYLILFASKTHKTGFPSSDQLVDRIIRLTMQTGFATSVCASLDLLFFLLFPNGLHLVFNFALSKLYANSLMSTLNSRMGWRFSVSNGGSGGGTFPDLALEVTDDPTPSHNGSTNLPSMQFTSPRPLEIYTSSESHEFRDPTFNSDFTSSVRRGSSFGGTGLGGRVVGPGVVKRKVSQGISEDHDVNGAGSEKRISAAETLVEQHEGV